MAENLNYKTNDSWCYDNNSSNCQQYGRLYTWKAALSACPSGWHLPSDNEWETLAQYMAQQSGATAKSGDDYTQLGKYLKSTSGWTNNGNGTDAFGFSGLPAGSRDSDGDFYYRGSYGSWWSATEKSGSSAWVRNLIYINDYFGRNYGNKSYALSVRCFQGSN